MVAAHFRHVDTWVFDLDNTLYHPSAGLFAQMDAKLSAYVCKLTGKSADDALKLCHDYWREHGSTLAGLIAEFDIEPQDYLIALHDIDISHLAPEPQLARVIKALPGRKIVFTNGAHHHAERVLAARGLTQAFDAVYGVEQAEFLPKPHAAAFDKIFKKDGVTPQTAAMFEDEPRNLAVPHALGMCTVHVHDTPQPADHIQHHTSDLTGFLSQLTQPPFPATATRPMS